jgi:hypothetical protein
LVRKREQKDEDISIYTLSHSSPVTQALRI